MNNWLDSIQDNNTENEINFLLDELLSKFPNEKKSIEEVKSLLRNNPLSDDLLFEIREKLKRIISKDEHNLIRKREQISKIIKQISTYKIDKNEDGLYDFEDCFYDDFDFKIGQDYYYLKFPSLHEKVDIGSNTELMLDRYIKDFIKSSLLNYQAGRKNFERFREFTLIIIHYLKPENASLIDTDNIEIKKPIDAINKVLIENDTANFSDIFQIVQTAESEFTEMYVVKGHALSGSILRLLEGLK